MCGEESHIFGFKLPKVISPAARQLKCSDPKVCDRWISAYESYIRQHKLHVRLFDLERNIQRRLGDTVSEGDLDPNMSVQIKQPPPELFDGPEFEEEQELGDQEAWIKLRGMRLCALDLLHSRMGVRLSRRI